MARIINAFRPELHEQFAEVYPSIERRMRDICANPNRPVNLRTADAVVTAMGCPHVLTNGAVRVVTYNRRNGGGRFSYPQVVPEQLLAAPFRKWMERQRRHYKTLTAMYHDLGLTHAEGTKIWRGYQKHVSGKTVVHALGRREVQLSDVYPNGNGNGKVI
jgi:hypothetical protein